MDRRTFLKTSALFGAGCFILPQGCSPFKVSDRKKVLVLGIDGMDVQLTERYIKKGCMPNLKRLIKKGGFKPVQTSMPPQSPVAWSNFSVGASSQVHGIYDFIHRDPKTLSPYLSSSQVLPPQETINIGSYTIPILSGGTKNLRKGRPFWERLAKRDIPTTIFKMPANFPCQSDKVDMVSGMGTPDLRGGYGSFTLLTSAPLRYNLNLTGGKLIPVRFFKNTMEASIPGPENTLQTGHPVTSIPISVWRDQSNPVIRLKVQDKEILLREGEWSDWINVSFSMVPFFYDVKGIFKAYLKEVRPDFALYLSPINIDPAEPVLPIISSQDYGQDLVKNVGSFFTQGLPDDTKALSEGILDDGEYLQLAHQVLEERKRLFEYELNRLRSLDHGMLFFYVSSIDQNTHMLWRLLDSTHPMFDQTLARRYQDAMTKFYGQADSFLGMAMNAFDINDPDFTLMVMSDHGFAPFQRQVHLNTWLHEQGFMSLDKSRDLESAEFLSNVY